MSVTILIPTALRQYVANQDSIAVDGGTVGEVLSSLTEQHPQLKTHLYKEDGVLRSFVNLYLNDEDVRYLQKESTPVKEGDSIMIVPAVAGGASQPARRLEPHDAEIELSHEEVQRYSRHLIMPEVAVSGQKKLKQARVLLVGAGGLGSPLAIYLAAAGLGTIGLVDSDVVDYTNLHRQVIHFTSDVGRSKLESARDTIAGINPNVQVDLYETMLNSENALAIMADYDMIIDGTDNFATRYLVNDACVLLGKPNVYGSIFRFEGQASVFWAEKGPCYRCLYPEPPPPGLVPSCAEGGVLGVLPGTVGLIQATEAIKLIIGHGESLIGRLLTFDASAMRFRELKIHKNPDCPICSEKAHIKQLIDYQVFCGTGPRVVLQPEWEITATELTQEIAQSAGTLLLDVREPHEFELCHIDNSYLIPLGQLEMRISELDRASDIVAICRSGSRSATATKFLIEAGFGRVRNLVGGVLAWADQVDPSMPKY